MSHLKLGFIVDIIEVEELNVNPIPTWIIN